MWCQIVRMKKNGYECYEARVYAGTVVKYRQQSWSEAGARTWLAQQGIPFNRQPRNVAVLRSAK